MEPAELDDLDRTIIHALQDDARGTSASDIAEKAGVSPSTVRQRIARLEEAGVARGYHLDVDYERAGFQLHTLIVCTAPIPEREELARRARRAALRVAGDRAVWAWCETPRRPGRRYSAAAHTVTRGELTRPNRLFHDSWYLCT